MEEDCHTYVPLPAYVVPDVCSLTFEPQKKVSRTECISMETSSVYPMIEQNKSCAFSKK